MGFLMKVDTSGELNWFRRVQSSVTEIADIAASTDQIFLIGKFVGIQRFANNEGTNAWINLSGNGAHKYYYAAYDYSGTLVLSKAESSANEVNVKTISVLPDNHYFLGAEFECAHTEFQPDSAEATFLSRGGSDIFISSYSPLGSRLWSKHIGGVKAHQVNGSVVNGLNEFVIAGSFEQTLASPSKSSWVAYLYLFRMDCCCYCG